MKSKRVGVIVEVNDQFSKVGVYSLLNDRNIIWNGELLSGIKVGAYLTVNQNDIKVIATVSSEKVIDQQNTVKSEEFDNRFHKNSVNRIIELKTKGVIENNEFKITSKYVPMIGNEVTLTSKEELDIIYGLKTEDKALIIGKTVLEDYSAKIPINKFFASHIGIFGNTGSGKSNTLHKLYFELFKSEYITNIKKKSKFFIIDFNGEYCRENIFGLNDTTRKIIRIDTRNSADKLNIKSDYIFDADILSILFDARPATQVPFLKKAVKRFLKIENEVEYANIEIGLLITILRMIRGNNHIDCLDDWIKASLSAGVDKQSLEQLNDIFSNLKYGDQKLKTQDGIVLLEDTQLTEVGRDYFKIDKIEEVLKKNFKEASKLKQFLMFLEFQRVYEITYNATKADFINPLFSRIRPAISSLDKVLKVDNTKSKSQYKMMTIISLVNANSEVKRLIPMLLSKMIYDEHKAVVSKMGLYSTIHLIIDEAHNILNSQFKNIGDDWQDYRLSIFEEIIKEGRKFGFYLTLASQRPADISQTIMSQLHNYIIHRLVNERDLQMLTSTMPTLDLTSYRMIPILGQGEAIITGIAFKIPVAVKIDKENDVRPNSDDVILHELWV